jgi:hypothetical protein
MPRHTRILKSSATFLLENLKSNAENQSILKDMLNWPFLRTDVQCRPVVLNLLVPALRECSVQAVALNRQMFWITVQAGDRGFQHTLRRVGGCAGDARSEHGWSLYRVIACSLRVLRM